MAYKKLTTGETTQCYKNAIKKLAIEDRIKIKSHVNSLAQKLPQSRRYPNSDFVKLEILAKLGIWLNKKHPIKEND